MLEYRVPSTGIIRPWGPPGSPDKPPLGSLTVTVAVGNRTCNGCWSTECIALQPPPRYRAYRTVTSHLLCKSAVAVAPLKGEDQACGAPRTTDGGRLDGDHIMRARQAGGRALRSGRFWREEGTLRGGGPGVQGRASRGSVQMCISSRGWPHVPLKTERNANCCHRCLAPGGRRAPHDRRCSFCRFQRLQPVACP